MSLAKRLSKIFDSLLFFFSHAKTQYLQSQLLLTTNTNLPSYVIKNVEENTLPEVCQKHQDGIQMDMTHIFKNG